MSDNPKDDDWGMTMPNVRLDDEKKKDGSGASAMPSFQPKTDAPPNLPTDDWGMTAPNVNISHSAVPPSNQAANQQFSDFDKTAPNINVPPQYTEKAKQTPPVDDWGVTEANINVPKENKKDDWQMPQPTFRVSEGATPNFDKTTPNFNLKDLNDDFGSSYSEEEAGNKTTPYYRLPENQAETPVAEASASAAVSNAESPTAKPAAPQSSGNMKWILMLGGLFSFFVLVVGAIVAVYFLYFNTPNNVTSTSNKPTQVAPTAAPTVAATNTLPGSVDYKGEMVLVAGGEFTMGTDAGGDESKPAHKVDVPAFYIDKTEVTNAQYKAFCEATGTKPPTDPFWEQGYFEKRPDAPVLGVSFDDAKAFAAWAGKRLPTEAEWEKAASWDAASQTKLDFPWGASFESGKAAFGLDTPKDVGSYPSGASPSGAMDMAGNVAEWVDAFFQPYPGNTASNSNFGDVNRVARGGFFGSKTNEHLRTTKRIYLPPSVASGEDEEKLFAAAIGFRCAVSADDARLQESFKK